MSRLDYPIPPACLSAFDPCKAGQEMAVKALFGEIPIRGRMPENLKQICRHSDNLELL